jgi:hypothetical protein
MEPYEVKKTIREKTEEYNALKESVLNEIGQFINYLKRISDLQEPRYICADGKPFTLELTQVKPFKVILDTTNGLYVLLEDEQTTFPIKMLPLEDMIQLWKRLFYQ